ncbi:hypothetical protein QBC35DRAFT_18470 [Podospora australis]|uniref:Enoyl reductase (ER) domain-containing protein n=1 Tax=Podospora australis TaxID=1536484 RepID=A0AAN6WRX3_9PEZI|nr:hypothetical protein QBC35DRAFT_18470 [Podospora australis]
MASPATQPTIRAWTSKTTGPPREALTLQTARPAPPPPTGNNILIKVSYASLNPADLFFIRCLPPWLPFRSSPVYGLDLCGEVIATGPAVTRTTVGEKVSGAMGLAEVTAGMGGLAEVISVDAGLVAKIPDETKLEMKKTVGAMGIAGQTALMMIKSAGVRAGQTVLVNGASGGVGSLAVQICKGIGARVVGVCSGRNGGFVKGLGADEIIDYKAYQPLEDFLATRFLHHELDVILDCAGSQELYSNSPRYLKEQGGKFVTCVGGWSQGVIPFVRNKLRPVILGGTPRPYHLFLLGAQGVFAEEIADYVEKGMIKDGPIDSEFDFEHVVEAYERLATGRARGKIVVKVASD